MMDEEEFKEHCKVVGKTIWYPEVKKLSDLFEKIIPYSKNGEGYYLAVRTNESIPNAFKSIRSNKSYRVIVKEEYAQSIREQLLDKRDEISFELIDWGDNQALLTINNSLIISDRWANLITFNEKELEEAD